MTFLCIECGKSLDESIFFKKVKNKCEDCLNEKIKCQVCGKFLTNKRLTSHIEREHQPNALEKNFNNNNNKIILPEKRNNENKRSVSAYENHRHVFIGPRNTGKTY